MIANIKAAMEAVGLHDFNRQELLEIALNHPDAIAEQSDLSVAQKQLRSLEHIGLVHVGSLVLSAALSNYLYTRFPDLQPETLTLIKSDLIDNATRSGFAEQMGLPRLAHLGTESAWKHEIARVGIFAELFDAIVGAVYLECDRDIALTQTWLVEHFLAPAVDTLLMEAIAELHSN
ncbi:MAG: ribonuclease III domain-containing protein [Limnospira sp.]